MKKLFTLIMFSSAVLLLHAQNKQQITPIVKSESFSGTKAGTNAAKFNPNNPYATTCDTLNWPIAAAWLPPVYYIAGTLADGFVNGPNLYADREKAQFFDASASPFTKLHGFFLQFGHAYTANPAKIITFRVYDGTGPNPGAVLATKTMTMAEIMADVQNNFYTEVQFQTAINLPASKRFFIGVDISALTWSTLPKDSLTIISNTHLDTSPSLVWEKQSDNLWYRYNTPGSWALDISLFIFPYITNQQTLVGFTPSPIPNVCSGQSVNYNAAPSLPYAQLAWNFPGGTPTSSTTQTQSVQYNTAGTYTTKLFVLGGGCPTLDSAQASVTVLQSPGVTPNPSTVSKCPTASTVLNVSGANSYTWAPATGLSASTGASVTCTVTTTTTYTITGTSSNGCTGTSTVVVTINPLPVASVTTSNLTICDGGTVTFNASGSTNVTGYNWTFTGGSPASSTIQVPTIMYATPGTYTATLSASNACGTDNSYSAVVNVQNCTSVDELAAEETSIHFDHVNGNILLHNGQNGINGRITFILMNAVGQVVFNGTFDLIPGSVLTIPAGHIANGAYFTEIKTENISFTKKFIK